MVFGGHLLFMEIIPLISPRSSASLQPEEIALAATPISNFLSASSKLGGASDAPGQPLPTAQSLDLRVVICVTDEFGYHCDESGRADGLH